MNNKDKLINTIKDNQGLLGEVDVKSQAQQAINAQKDALETQVGGIANEVKGGVQSLTSKFDKFQNKLNNTTTEGLLNETSKSIDNLATNMVDELIGNVTAPTTSKIQISFTSLDLGNGMSIQVPDTSSLEPTGGGSTISDVLKQITGLDVGGGNLQKQVLDASPDGLLKAVTRVEGKIGAFTSETINSLASDTITSVTDILEATGAGADINRRVQYIDTSLIEADSTQPNFGEVVSGAITQVTEGDARTANLGEFNAAIQNVKDKPLATLQALVTKDKETKANLAAGSADFSDLTGGKDGVDVIKSVRTQQQLRDKYQELATEKVNTIASRVAGDGEVGVVQSLSADTFTTVANDLQELVAPKKLSRSELNTVINLSQGNPTEFSRAVDLISSKINIDDSLIQSRLRQIDTTITTALEPEIDQPVFDEPYVIGSYADEWNGGQGDPVFPYISSVEELQAELKEVTRDITEVVVHWSETPTNKNIGSEELNDIHLEAGLNGIGYHYIIRRDGSLQRGRPVNLQGQHASNNGHDSRSIAIVFIGGINVPSETRNLEDFISVRSLTRSQFNTFDHFCRAFYAVWPGGQILGHSDIDSLANDPGFDVRAYVKANFDKDSKFTTPLTQSPFTADEINS